MKPNNKEMIMKAIVIINLILSIVFTICYFYQAVYIFVGLFKKTYDVKCNKNHRYAVIVSARNESKVIGNLIKSIQNQTYPAELVDIFVVADNCTDNTAEISRRAGAVVYERFNDELVGKGYALDWIFKIIKAEHSDKKYEAYIVFDADNVLDPHFIEEMNKTFDSGYRVITSYRNSKNFGENWITAGYSLWFLREARYLNNSRMQLGTSCAISGTGFLVSAEIIEENGGWIHHLLTEDIEFTTDSIIKGEIIGYAANAVVYDEQPSKFSQSYFQRMRWAKGFYQVFAKYGKGLVKGVFRGSFPCYDMLMTIMPAMLITFLSIAINIVAIPAGMINHSPYMKLLLITLGQTLLMFYMMFFTIGLITTITEWKQIYCSAVKKIKYLFTFPIFMLTYVPISISALFHKVEWKQIDHSVSKTLEEIHSEVPIDKQ